MQLLSGLDRHQKTTMYQYVTLSSYIASTEQVLNRLSTVAEQVEQLDKE